MMVFLIVTSSCSVGLGGVGDIDRGRVVFLRGRRGLKVTDFKRSTKFWYKRRRSARKMHKVAG